MTVTRASACAGLLAPALLLQGPAAAAAPLREGAAALFGMTDPVSSADRAVLP